MLIKMGGNRTCSVSCSMGDTSYARLGSKANDKGGHNDLTNTLENPRNFL